MVTPGTNPASRVPGKAALRLPVILLIVISMYGFIVLHSSGDVGATMKNGSGCSCHGFVPVDSVHVWISGPDTVARGRAAEYVIGMAGGPAVVGGFNVAASRGTLDTLDATVRLLTGELTHSSPKAFQNDTVRWRFRYQAPPDGLLDTLFSVANSANGNGNPNGDAFNFGANFTVHLVDSTVGAVADRTPAESGLRQNYPNPFNPATRIDFSVLTYGHLSLKVFNAAGEEVATLAAGMKQPGTYSVTFDGSGLASGMYFCRMQAGEEMTVRKMLLVK